MDCERPEDFDGHSPHSQYNKRTKHAPWFIIAISFIQALVYYSTGERTIFLLQYDPKRRHEAWRFVTPMLINFSSAELWDNLICQVILGSILELEHHAIRIAVIYTVSCIGGTMLSALVYPQEFTIGQSTSVFTLLSAHIANFLINWNTMTWRRCRVFWPLLFVMITAGKIFYDISYLDPLQHNPIYANGNASLLGGVVLGFLMSLVLLRSFERNDCINTIRRLSAGIIVIYFLVVVLINLAFPSHFLKTNYNDDYIGSYFKYVAKLVIKSEENSFLRVYCDTHKHCTKALLKLKASQ